MNTWSSILYHVRKIIPVAVFTKLQPTYHLYLTAIAAAWYRFPSRKIPIIAVTGTKGKSSVTEIVNALFEEAGYKTALSNTIRFKIGNLSTDNLYKMSMPGRFFIQNFLHKAVKAHCDFVIMEVTSQGALMNRHRFIDFDALIFTGIAPEHIEAHGSFENYLKAKLSIAEAVAKSKKKKRVFVGDADDKHIQEFTNYDFTEKILVSTNDAKPYKLMRDGSEMTVDGMTLHSHLQGTFNIWNALASIRMAQNFGISVAVAQKTLEKFSGIRGRVEKINAGQDFEVVVDYAHTPDSLQKFYDVFHGTRRICILGNTGGGRDTWKRDEMAKIAENECDEIILTNEDPYDDDPQKIVTDMAQALTKKKPHIIMDRRDAIAHALSLARSGDSVLITGKGTDPYIMGAHGSKIPWSDARVAREELLKLTKKS